MIDIRKIDLHMHSSVSDGTDTPEELLEKVREAGIELFALTDHDAVRGCAVIQKMLSADDPVLLSGAEFSCRDEKGKYHILGYGFDLESESVRKIVETGHQLRIRKARLRLERLQTAYGFVFPDDDVRDLFSKDNPGKPHIGNMLVRLGYARNREQAISDYINQIHVRGEYERPEDVIQGILQGGGIPILAHPAFGSGKELIIGENMDRRLRHLTALGLKGVEAFYSDFTPELQNEMLYFAEKYGLYITAGSDYHGRNKPVLIGDTKIDEERPMPDGMKRFLEEVVYSKKWC